MLGREGKDARRLTPGWARAGKVSSMNSSSGYRFNGPARFDHSSLDSTLRDRYTPATMGRYTRQVL